MAGAAGDAGNASADDGANVELVVPRDPSRAPDGAELRRRLARDLSSYKVPARVLAITGDQVPWMSSQKADRRALTALAEKLLLAAENGAA